MLKVSVIINWKVDLLVLFGTPSFFLKNGDRRYKYLLLGHEEAYLCPPPKKEGHIALHMSVGLSVRPSVGMAVSLNHVQLITQECFAPQASNMVDR